MHVHVRAGSPTTTPTLLPPTVSMKTSTLFLAALCVVAALAAVDAKKVRHTAVCAKRADAIQ